VTWTKDNEVFVAEPGVCDTWQEDGLAVLMIKSCKRTDRGEYGICVENYIGCDEATFFVEVNGM
jgi:hypothetical protein